MHAIAVQRARRIIFRRGGSAPASNPSRDFPGTFKITPPGTFLEGHDYKRECAPRGGNSAERVT